ncbi:amidase family protein [Pseudonocardia sp. D17]|uniref:amidase family protein n=1 Tax=Pseudonocardia sp. D17 TaxID=882661 RepID=UPI002B3C2AD1|nr:hypothetical protein PSD17_09180 [Pseudonocardia sp. D17]
MTRTNPSSAESSGNSQLTELGVAAAAAAIRRGDVTAESYASALLDQARAQSEIHAFITIDESAVLGAASAADEARAAGATAPLLGVPLGVKDSYQTRDLPTSLGLGSLTGFTPSTDAEIVTAIEGAGAIVFGKNNLVEMSYGVTGHNADHGQVLNPYDQGRQHLRGEVVQQVVAAARRCGAPAAQRQSGQLQARGPALGPSPRGRRDRPVERRPADPLDQGGRLVEGETQVGRAQLGELAPGRAAARAVAAGPSGSP